VQGRGRVFYTGAGHREDVVESDWFASHLLGGIRWALGR
jgi:type 1 glutamine amidotransferase